MRNRPHRALPFFAVAVVVALIVPPIANGGLDSKIVRRLGPTYLEGFLYVDLLRAEGRYEEALDLNRRSLEIFLGPEGASPGWVLGCREQQLVLEKVVTLPAPSRRQMEVADSLSLQIRFDWCDGLFEEGRRRAERRLEIQRRLLGADHPETARSLHDLGKFLHALGRIRGAESAYRQALDIWDRHADANELAIAETLQYLGELLNYNGEVTKAERLQRKALELRVSVLGEDDELIDRSCLEIAQLQIDRGEFAFAEPLLRQALYSCRARWGGDHWLNATLMDNLGLVLEEQGDYVGAERLFKDVLALRRRLLGEDHPHIARSLRSLGLVQQRQGRLDEAEAHLEEALQKQRVLFGEEHLQTALASRDLALLLRSRGDLEGAERLVLEVLAASRTALGERHPAVADDLSSLGSILLAQGKPREAIGYFDEALELLPEHLDRAHPRAVAALQGIAVARLQLGQTAAARETLNKLARDYEVARLLAGTGYVRATFRSSPYLYLAASELALGNESDAWIAAEKGLGRALADLLFPLDLRIGESARIDPEAQALLGRVSTLERQVAILRDSPRAVDRRRLEQARTDLLAAEAAWLDHQREAGLSTADPDHWDVSLDAVQAAVPPNGAIIGWIDPEMPDGRAICWGYVIRDRGPVRWVSLDRPPEYSGSIAHEAEELRLWLAMAGSWLFRLNDTRRIDALAMSVWESWVKPLMPHLRDVDHLVVLPVEPLLGVPVEALVDDQGRYLADRYAISYAPSATVYAGLKRRDDDSRDRAIRKVLLVGDPPFCEAHRAAMAREANTRPDTLRASASAADPLALRSALAGNDEAIADLPRLIESREEIESIAAVVDEELILLGPDASEPALVRLAATDALGDFNAIHLATHALIDEDLPERSVLVLSQTDLPDPYKAVLREERIFDGLLSLKEISREWDLDAELVTLSGCQTALGRRTRGEGLIGLQHALLQVGARNVVLSLWKVDDSATSLLMGRFYQNLTRSGRDPEEAQPGVTGPAESLREAKQWLRGYTDPNGDRPFIHPVYWAGFILVGCGESGQ